MVMKIPVAPTAAEKKKEAEEDYQKLLQVGDITLPDPRKIEEGWLSEVDGIAQWPPCMHYDIGLYLAEKCGHGGATIDQRLMKARSGHAYSMNICFNLFFCFAGL
jgi:hypothetical protein